MVMPSDVDKIGYQVLNKWNDYVIKYFSISPNTFFIQNQFFSNMPEKMKTEILVKNMSLPSKDKEFLVIPSFLIKFDYVFKDK